MNKSIKIFSTVEKLSLYFAKTLSEYVSKTPEDRFFSLALSGGSTPKVVFEFIALNFKNKINWRKVIIEGEVSLEVLAPLVVAALGEEDDP